MLNLPYTSDTESEKEELIEVSHHQNSPPKELPSYPDNILPTSLETVSPLPHNYSNKCISVDPELSEALLGPLGTFHALQASYLYLPVSNVPDDYQADSRTLKCENNEMQIILY